jgi:hypothetical protein
LLIASGLFLLAHAGPRFPVSAQRQKFGDVRSHNIHADLRSEGFILLFGMVPPASVRFREQSQRKLARSLKPPGAKLADSRKRILSPPCGRYAHARPQPSRTGSE